MIFSNWFFNYSYSYFCHTFALISFCSDFNYNYVEPSLLIFNIYYFVLKYI